MNLDDITRTVLDGRTKGIPGTAAPFPLSEIAVLPLSAILPLSATEVLVELFELSLLAVDPPAAAAPPAEAVLVSGVAAGVGVGAGVSAIAGIAIAVMKAAMAVLVRSLCMSGSPLL